MDDVAQVLLGQVTGGGRSGGTQRTAHEGAEVRGVEWGHSHMLPEGPGTGAGVRSARLEVGSGGERERRLQLESYVVAVLEQRDCTLEVTAGTLVIAARLANESPRALGPGEFHGGLASRK